MATLKKGQKKWLLIGALICGLTLLNALRFMNSLPPWVLMVGVSINLVICFTFVWIYLTAAEDN